MVLNFFRRPKIGSVKVEQASVRDAEELDIPAQSGHLKGVLVPSKTSKETYFYAYDDQRLYFTYQEYGEWQGMVCEGPVEQDGSMLDDLSGYAYKLFVRCNGDGKLYELPSPDVIRGFPKSNECRCPFCMIEHAQGIKIGGN